jgi:hypothetical protein
MQYFNWLSNRKSNVPSSSENDPLVALALDFMNDPDSSSVEEDRENDEEDEEPKKKKPRNKAEKPEEKFQKEKDHAALSFKEAQQENERIRKQDSELKRRLVESTEAATTVMKAFAPKSLDQAFEEPGQLFAAFDLDPLEIELWNQSFQKKLSNFYVTSAEELHSLGFTELFVRKTRRLFKRYDEELL